jgi:deoxyribodipyrimidine photo-lyase
VLVGQVEIHGRQPTGDTLGDDVETAVVLFTRDLRVHDQPALAAAHRDADRVIRLFVHDPAITASPRRLAFLDELLATVPDLVVTEGDPVEEVGRVHPDVVYCSEDASPYAQRREQRLSERFDLRLFAGNTVIGLEDVKPYRVFTPYYRVWSEQPRRALEEPPGRAAETPARLALAAWLRDPHETGSRLSPYMHFGALSSLECVVRGTHKPEFVRQLCWRDFYAQLLRARPDDFALAPRAEPDERFEAWRAGRTGVPFVDAGMAQLVEEGWMPNRVRMVAASYLVHDLAVDWRLGARHFERFLLDGDVASNRGNWLWVVKARHRIFNPYLQAKKHDPEGSYVRRWAPQADRR